ncbi:triphosphoribosyl-dephospho-CoA synthase MdcB [Massilia sp. DWR3-1-1]|uniref:triphosphoribosyl-dephospho-CoA synthase MdcB n=1 Tax=Massilia sp. DWR3-1-1 TaxID=2804559 RepID=UPI003CF0DFB7
MAPAVAVRMDGETARLALACLHAELLLYPKPGLVSPVDNGSHTDMNAATFMRSLLSLRHYFAAICRAGAADAPFAELRQLGVLAERRMLLATGGINTHRGAIFCLGLLCAAHGRLRAQGQAVDAAALRATLLRCWGGALAAHASVISSAATTTGPASHGALVAHRHAAAGAREEAALGLPSVFEVGLPALHGALRAGRPMQAARTDALFALMAHISDTNVLYRGGAGGAALVRRTARAFIDAGGTAHPDWLASAVAAHRSFVRRRLSPGGAADLLAATCFVHAVLP